MQVIDGKDVWGWHATHGFPLEIALPELARRDLVPAWDRLLSSAKADGANMPRLIERLVYAVYDAYEKADADVIAEKLERLA